MLHKISWLVVASLLWCAPAAAGPAEILERLLETADKTAIDKPAAIALIEATAKIRRPENALPLVEKYSDHLPIEELRERLVAACADLSDFDCAYYEAAKITPFNWRMRALSQIASAYAEQGDTERARSAFTSILASVARDSPESYRDQLLVGLMRSVAEFAFIDIGLQGTKAISDPGKKADALFTLAIAAGKDRHADQAASIYRDAVKMLEAVPNWQLDSWRTANAAVAAFASGHVEEAERLVASEKPGTPTDWAYGQIAALLHRLGQPAAATKWENRITDANKKEWVKGLVAETYMKDGNCAEALSRFRTISSNSWAAATILHLAEQNSRKVCTDGATFADEADRLVDVLGSNGDSRLLAQLATALQAAAPKPNELWTGRTRWQCTSEPIIYPGWWDQASKGLPTPADLNSADGHRATAPTVVKLGRGKTSRYYLYYLGEGPIDNTRVLRVEISPSDPTHPRPRNVALEFSGPFNPENGNYGTEYLHLGPYYGAVLEDLDDVGEPAKDADGKFKPWFMYIATHGNNPGVAVSMDGGITFALPSDPAVNPIFPFEVFKDPAKDGGWRRIPLEPKNKMYDQSGSGSADAIRGPDGKLHMFYTARMWNYMSLDDIGAAPSDVFHRDGHIPDHGIGYAESTDGLHWNRRTSTSLGVTSPVAKGTGRIIDPRYRDGPPGELEYTLTRPMVFPDGIDAVTGAARYRMLVSSLSSTYRVRSLHSTDLINWHWDASPKNGLFGLGEKGSFDDKSATYGDCLRESGPDGDRYMCWYTGNRFGHYSAGKTGIGFCTMPAKN